jgi:hypothetical protein
MAAVHGGAHPQPVDPDAGEEISVEAAHVILMGVSGDQQVEALQVRLARHLGQQALEVADGGLQILVGPILVAAVDENMLGAAAVRHPQVDAVAQADVVHAH